MKFRDQQRCRYSWFVVLGTLEILVATTLAIAYFYVRTVTSSLEKVETVPTYANAIMLMCTGILTTVLFIKRDSILLWPAGSLSVASLLFFTTCGILSGIQTSNTVDKIQKCTYIENLQRCACNLKENRTSAHLILGHAAETIVYEGAPSCQAIRVNLRNCMYTMCGLYIGGAIICLIGFLMILLASNKNMKVDIHRNTNNNYVELIRSSSSASHNSAALPRNVDSLPSGSRSRNRQRRTSTPRTENRTQSTSPAEPPPPKRNRRRRPKFSRQISLPGMGFCLLNQQLRLPGEEHLQLLSVQRTNSQDQEFGPRSAGPQPIRSHSVNNPVSHTRRAQPVQSVGMSPGVHTPQAQVRRTISLDQQRPTNGETSAGRVGGAAAPTRRELLRSQSDTTATSNQRAINLFRLERVVRQNRSENRPTPRAQRSQSDRTVSHSPDHCRHCRDYRLRRRTSESYCRTLPNTQMYPLPQHVMIMNYLMSTQGRGHSLAAAFQEAGLLYDPPPPYQEEGPPPYSPGTNHRRILTQQL